MFATLILHIQRTDAEISGNKSLQRLLICVGRPSRTHKSRKRLLIAEGGAAEPDEAQPFVRGRGRAEAQPRRDKTHRFRRPTAGHPARLATTSLQSNIFRWTVS